MKRFEHIGEGPNIAGISLALYLLAALLSMMAAYEAGKGQDEFRSSVAVAFQSIQTAPNKDGDGDDDLLLVPDVEPVPRPLPAPIARLRNDRTNTSFIHRAFNARAPPLHSIRIV